jgi:tripartite-type tricarboxylate transporter receptor subunit TctC
VILAIFAWFALVEQAIAQSSPEDFFRGKTLRVVIPASPGAARGTSATLFTSYLRKHIPGNPTVVPTYMPGAGGAVGMNYLYNVAPRDGTAIITPLTTAVLAQAIGEKSTKYDVTKMHWIGRTATNSQIVYVWHTTGVTDIEGVRRRQITLGSSGAGSSQTILPLIMNEVLGTKFKVIQGYKGSAAFNLAVERGELDAALTTWATLQAASHLEWVESGKARVIVQLALTRHPELSKVPLATELTSDPDGKALLEFASSTAEFGQAYVAPPDVPAPIIAALRRAFDETIKDPEYMAAAKKADIELSPMTGNQMSELAQRMLSVPKRIIERYKAAVGAK